MTSPSRSINWNVPFHGARLRTNGPQGPLTHHAAVLGSALTLGSIPSQNVRSRHHIHLGHARERTYSLR